MERPSHDRIAVIDEDSASRTRFSTWVESMGMPCGEFASAEELLKQENLQSIVCIVSEQALPGMKGLDLLKQLRTQGELIPVVIVSEILTVALAVQWMQAGAFSVLEKPCSPELLAPVLLDAVKYTGDQRAQQARIEKWQVAIRSLTEDEKQVAQGIAAGTPNAQLAQRLKLGLRTVEKRRRKVLEKLSVDSLPALIEIIFHVAPELLEDPSE